MNPDRSTLIMPSRPPRRAVPHGRRLAGRYLIGEVIGRGGMSTVHRARDEVLDRDVAVKILLPALAEGDPAHVARFEREARAAAALHHPAVVKIYDTGHDRGTHFIVMEYVAGQSLDRLLADGRPLDPEEASRIAGQVAAALAAAHVAGILHRDVKPANVMVTPEREIKVLDFGIARARHDPTLTQPTFAIGTASYMAPERVLGQPGDERSDIYSLGCLLYAMLAGRPPFVAESTLSVLHQQVHEQPAPLGGVGAPALETLVMGMLAKEPGARPQTASEITGRLARPAPIPTVATYRAQRRRRLPVAGLAIGALLVVVLGLVIGNSGGPSLAAHRSTARRLTAHHSVGARVTRAATPVVHPTAPKPAAKPIPPGHGGTPPGHRLGGPPGHKDKPPKPPKAKDGAKWQGDQGNGGD
jgi:serine/threonine-protein kinase